MSDTVKLAIHRLASSTAPAGVATGTVGPYEIRLTTDGTAPVVTGLPAATSINAGRFDITLLSRATLSAGPVIAAVSDQILTTGTGIEEIQLSATGGTVDAWAFIAGPTAAPTAASFTAGTAGTLDVSAMVEGTITGWSIAHAPTSITIANGIISYDGTGTAFAKTSYTVTASSGFGDITWSQPIEVVAEAGGAVTLTPVYRQSASATGAPLLAADGGMNWSTYHVSEGWTVVSGTISSWAGWDITALHSSIDTSRIAIEQPPSTARYNPDFSLTRPLPAGTYRVAAYTAEDNASTAVGDRVFNLYVNGTLVAENFDTIAELGGAGILGVIEHDLTTAGEDVVIRFQRTTGTKDPLMVAVEILEIT